MPLHKCNRCRKTLVVTSADAAVSEMDNTLLKLTRYYSKKKQLTVTARTEVKQLSIFTFFLFEINLFSL